MPKQIINRVNFFQDDTGVPPERLVHVERVEHHSR